MTFYFVGLVGLSLALGLSALLFMDLVLPRVALNGRVENVRVGGGRFPGYLAEIGGQTVWATRPVYERLKLHSVVRAEVGRGTNYIYRIEDLAK